VKRALITGATGFIGSALCQRLLQEDWQVRSALRSMSSRKLLPPGVEAGLVGPIGPYTAWDSSLDGVDTLIHLAARAHVMRENADDSLASYRLLNTAGTERLARAAAAAGVRRFVYLSSVKVSGEGRAEPYMESDAPAPEDAYGISKWEAEQALHAVSRETGLQVAILRPPLVYGPGVKANFLQLMKIVSRGLPLPLAGVHNRRSMIYLENLVDAIMTCVTHPNAVGRTYLVSDGEDLLTTELIRRLAAALGIKSRLLPFPPLMIRLAGRLSGRSREVERFLGSLTLDTTKIRHELGWKPPYSMDEGLKETAEWFLKRRC
jgi:nucleoside-diphosphate-sugar epimerase